MHHTPDKLYNIFLLFKNIFLLFYGERKLPISWARELRASPPQVEPPPVEKAPTAGNMFVSSHSSKSLSEVEKSTTEVADAGALLA